MLRLTGRLTSQAISSWTQKRSAAAISTGNERNLLCTSAKATVFSSPGAISQGPAKQGGPAQTQQAE